ncbi:MAG: hypothetical protein ACK41E_09640 [Deinococcales bacterium]
MLLTLRCELTQLELGAELEDASRYADIMVGRLEIVCEALEAIGLRRRAELMRGWLTRWLRVVDVLFEERLAQNALLPSNQLVESVQSKKMRDAS